MPGAPFIYYGDEIGMRHVENLTSVEGGYNRTGARSPMQWDLTPNAGFSSAAKEKLYIGQDEAADRPTVAQQMASEGSLYREVKRLIEIRQSAAALQSNGGIEFVYVKEKKYPLAYTRSSGDEKILVVINPGREEASFEGEYEFKEVIYGFGGELVYNAGKITVPGGSAFYIRLG